MQRDTTKKYYVLHSWVGALTAILLFVIAFTGAVSVFGRGELKVWANPEIRDYQQHDFAAIEQLVKKHAEKVGPEYWDHIEVFLPGPHGNSQLAIIFENEIIEDGVHRHDVVWFDHHPTNLSLIQERQGDFRELLDTRRTDMADFIVGFHADLHLGSPLGLILTGLLGLTLFASVITGLFIHPKILKDLFVFRPWRSLRLLFTDTHKVLGVWGLLFHGVIGFTGAFLGLATVVLIPVAALVSFEGDQERLVETFLPEVEPVITEVSTDMRFADTLSQLEMNEPELIIGRVTLYGWGDEGAVMALSTLGSGKLSGETLEFSAVTGDIISRYTNFGRLDGVSKYVLDAMAPLHFGNFAGVWVKGLWFFLGLSTALVAATGMMIWIERRAFGAEGSLSLKSYQWISRLTAGACGGIVAATSSLFSAQLILYALGMHNGNLTSVIGLIFFGVFSVSLVWSGFRSNAYQVTKGLLTVSGLLLLFALVVNGVTTGDWIVNSISDSRWITVGVDIALLVFGVGLIVAGLYLPAQRPQRERMSQDKKIFLAKEKPKHAESEVELV
ncbi:PepSY-associated TM helix domain-containing protein [Aurantivibrio plasticivorans]